MTGASRQGVELFVPGRVCLLGEHADWAGRAGRHVGYCLVVGTDQGIRATASGADELLVEAHLPAPDANADADGRPRRFRCAWDPAALLDAATDEAEFFRYCAGVAHEVSARYGVGGLELRMDRMDLPLKKGVASSAAVCILVAKAFDAAYGLNLFGHELMDLAYRGERLTGSQCGRMDQACLFGQTPVLLSFTAGDDVRIEPLFCERPIEMFLVDLGGAKDTVRILSDLQAAYDGSDDLQAALGPDNEAFVRLGCRALVSGDAAALGQIMTAAQANFDAKVACHCPDELAGALLHEVLAFAPIAGHVHGGKGVGSQGDGTAQFVARSAADRDAAMRKIVAAFPAMRCFPLTIAPAAAAGR